MSKRALDLSVLLLTVFFVGCIVFANEDPAARQAIFGDRHLGPVWHAKAVAKVLYDVGIGGIVSVAFYLLLVRAPEISKRRRIRRTLERQYEEFKRTCLVVMLGTFEPGRGIDTRLIDALLDQGNFQKYFREMQNETQSRWRVFLNSLSHDGIGRILRSAEILREEVNFVLSVVDIPSDDTFNVLKHLSGGIHSLTQKTEVKKSEIDYFLWSIFAGWGFAEGDVNEDPIAKMIRLI